MKSFRALYLTAIVAITMERCRAEFLLIEVNDDKGEGSRSNRTIKAQKIGELSRQGICDIKPCCCDDCYPCDYELIAEAQKLAEVKAHARGWCTNRCGHPLCQNCRRSSEPEIQPILESLGEPGICIGRCGGTCPPCK